MLEKHPTIGEPKKEVLGVLPQSTGQLFLSKDMNQLDEGSGLDSINDLREDYISQKCEALD